MILQTILVIILLANMRKYTRHDSNLYKWDRLIIAGIVCSSILLFLSFINNIKGVEILITVLSYVLTGSVIWFIFTQKIFFNLKSLVYAFIPLLGLNFIEDLLRFISRSFYKEWDTYLEIAEIFGLIWMIGMLIVTSKQRKALEKERRISEEKEREYKLSEKLKAELEIQVKERTAELTKQKEELLQTLDELKATQAQLVQSEKMASLGELTAGIAHEIQNPLNFVNNFSEVSNELIAEMKEEILKGNYEEVNTIAADVQQNLEKINHHGKRADAIVKGMLQHSRKSSGQKELTDINVLTDEYIRLCYHGLRAKDKSFNATINTALDENAGSINIISQDIGRVIMNLLTNAFYAVNTRRALMEEGYKPTVNISTKKTTDDIFISVSDNGMGIPGHVIDKIFQPFFTTKPTGEGTGLGLSMSYDIVTKGHGGELKVETKEKEGTTFTIILPVQ
jgi:signal transduction histidine kinase